MNAHATARDVIRQYGADPDTITDYQIDKLAALLDAQAAADRARADWLTALRGPRQRPRLAAVKGA